MEKPPAHARLALVALTAKNALKCLGFLEPPVPIVQLLEKHSCVHIFNEDIDDGFCFQKGDERHICINGTISAEAANYTRAHELGHLLLGHLSMDLSAITQQQAQNLKREADFFADNVVMPEHLVRDACMGDWVTDSIIESMARLFSVPVFAMRNRLRYLNIHCRSDNQRLHHYYHQGRRSRITA